MDQDNLEFLDEFLDSEIEEETNHEVERPSEEDTVIGWQKNVLSYLHDLVFGLVGILLVFMFVLRMVVVSGPSMMQTLQDGDRLILISNMFYMNPKYGDIVVASKDSFKNGEPIIKRVIATEGQEVNIDFNNGIVYVDDKPLDEPYTNTPTNLIEGTSFPLVVEKGCVFVLGDNRNDSLDSRSLEIGQIDKRELLGKAIFLAIPGMNEETKTRDWNRIGVLW